MSTSEPSEEALFRVVAGTPDDEELAALTAVVMALAGADADDRRGPGRSWLRRTMLRLHPLPGPGSWRRSGR